MRKHLFFFVFIVCTVAVSAQIDTAKYRYFEGGGDRGWSDNAAIVTDAHRVQATRDDLQSYLRDAWPTLVKDLKWSSVHSSQSSWNTVVALDTAESGRVTFLIHEESCRQKFRIGSAPVDTSWALGTLFLGKRP